MKKIETYQEVYIDLPFEDKMVEIRKKNILKFVRKYNSKNILEIGCGTNSLFNDIDKFNTFVVIEPSNKFYQIALDNAKSNNNSKNIFLYNDYFQNVNLNFDFDLVIISSLLHEIDAPIDFLKKVINISNKKTIIHINIPNAKSFHRLLAYEMGLIEDIYQQSETQKSLQITNTYDLNMLMNIINESGLEIIDKGSYFIKPFTHKQMKKLQEDNILSEKMIEGLYDMSKYMPEIGAEIFVNSKIKNDKKNIL